MYISIDGDNVGKKLEKYILNKDMNALSEFSNYISQVLIKIEELIKHNKGELFLSGGDNILAYVPDFAITELIKFINDINESSVMKFSMGYSMDIRITYLALKYAKSISPGTIVFAQSLENQISFSIISQV